jgi:hypothetical protein
MADKKKRSGGTDIEAGEVNVDGDVVGRDKTSYTIFQNTIIRDRGIVVLGIIVVVALALIFGPRILNSGADSAPTPTPLLTTIAPPPSAVVNTRYLADLVGKEPFTEQLPQPLISTGFGDVQINDVSAVQRLTAVQIKLSIDPEVSRTLPPEPVWAD